MIGASALHEAQVIGVIDDPGKIGVLVIDADLHVMAAVADHAVENWCSHMRPRSPLGKQCFAQNLFDAQAGRALPRSTPRPELIRPMSPARFPAGRRGERA